MCTLLQDFIKIFRLFLAAVSINGLKRYSLESLSSSGISHKIPVYSQINPRNSWVLPASFGKEFQMIDYHRTWDVVGWNTRKNYVFKLIPSPPPPKKNIKIKIKITTNSSNKNVQISDNRNNHNNNNNNNDGATESWHHLLVCWQKSVTLLIVFSQVFQKGNTSVMNQVSYTIYLYILFVQLSSIVLWHGRVMMCGGGLKCCVREWWVAGMPGVCISPPIRCWEHLLNDKITMADEAQSTWINRYTYNSHWTDQ